VKLYRPLALILGLALCSASAGAAEPPTPAKVLTGDLASLFSQPPPQAKPWVFWHWMDGNVTKEGITADLEAMSRIGVGGVLIMGVGLRTPPGKADFNSPLWRELYHFAAQECLRLGLHMALHQCDGWATAGGPWITPDRSMKKAVWTRLVVEGPRKEPIRLKQPSTVGKFYEDVAVFAVPLDEPSPLPVARAEADGQPAPALVDGDTKKKLPLAKDTIDLHLAAPSEVGSVVFHFADIERRIKVPATVEISEDGKTFRPVVDLQLNASYDLAPVETMTASFAPVRASVVRVRKGKHSNPGGLCEIEIFRQPRVHLWEVKSGFARRREHGGESPWLDAAPPAPDWKGIDPAAVIDLTGHLAEDGRLDWTPPPGRWEILRLGMTSTGKRVAPRTNAGPGLEVDKMSAEAMRFHFDAFSKGMIAENNPTTGNPIAWVHTDSWEAGLHTWGNGFRQEFEKRRGYSMMPWLAVLATGRIVGSAEESDRFLWDLRRTMGDLIAENFYGEMKRLSHENGVLFQSEAAGRQMFMYDPLNYAARTDMYVGEFWMPDNVRHDCRTAASAAHTYGRALAGAEAFTSGEGRYRDAPFDYKALGDRAFASGINRFIIHRYCMQPFTQVEPGMNFGQWGINFERTLTWWENGGKAWVEYLTRSQSLLQAGTFIADVIHYIGDDVPNFLGHREDLWNPVPPGYDFDGCNFDILRQLTVGADGRLALPSGMRYRVLLLPDRRHMTLEAAREVERLVQAGTVAVGPKPLRTPGLKDWQKNDAALHEITSRVWGDVDGEKVKKHRYGKGRVVYGLPLDEVLAPMAPPDFSYTSPDAATLNYIHRATEDADFYFVANANAGASVDVTARFRVTGRAPELWDPSTGAMVEAAVYRQVDGLTEMPLHLDPAGSCFVVFRKPASPQALLAGTPSMHGGPAGQYSARTAAGESATLTTKPTKVSTLEGPWQVSFPPGRGAPVSAAFPQLASWPENTDPGIKYFSGTATYRKSFNLDETQRPVILDLGKVMNIAEVAVNGKPLGTLWKPPFRVDISDAVRPGPNTLEVKITNLWPNRLIGDEQMHPDPSLDYDPNGPTWSAAGPLRSIPDWVREGKRSPVGRTTFVLWKFYDADSPLLTSGLLGPVTLETSADAPP
jgi:hypothetical protein